MKRLFAVGAVAVCAILAACQSPAYSSASSDLATHADSSARASIPTTQPLVGAYEKGSPSSWQPMATFAAATKIKPRIAGYYSGWYESFKLSFARQAWKHGAYVFVQMEPFTVTCAQIAAGKADTYLRSYADAVKEFGHPVIIAFGHEVNGRWYPWGASTPAKTYVAAWRHIVELFRSQGARNVTWMWAVNIGRFSLLQHRYPGAAYVNWIGVTGYYTSDRSRFSDVLAPTVKYVRKLAPGKPVIVDETGVAPDSKRTAQIKDLFQNIRTDHLLGAIYFDIDQPHTGPGKQDWRLEGHPAALAAFRAGARDLTPRR
jgi:mannan endo-1,4-beta-mannosidase